MKYIRTVKLTLKIKLLPTEQQASALLKTIKEANACCNAISEVAWADKIFNQFKIHKAVYHSFKSTYKLSAQVVVRCISKVADAYKLDRNTKRIFNLLGGIAYDARILSYRPDNSISIWTLDGRLKIPFVCHNPAYLPYVKGEADLVYKKGKFYLFQTVEIPDTDIEDVEDFIGVDFGLVSIATTSEGVDHSSADLTRIREQKQKVRSSIQRKGTKSSKRLLKRLSGRERTFASVTNHTVAKQIVAEAHESQRGIALEDLSGIRFSANSKGKKLRTRIGKWNFRQLREYIEYKARRRGVPVVLVNPRYTSKTCHRCKRIGKRQGKSFACDNCGNNMDADHNAAINIATLGAAVNQPEGSNMWCCKVHCSVPKPIPSALAVGG